MAVGKGLLLCEAAGYDVILVETVGVGQSEYEVADMVDFFLVLMLPNAGDELQGIKRGIMELADALIINKADGESLNLASQTMSHYQAAMNLLRHSSSWAPRVMTCSALNNERIDIVWGMVVDYCVQAREEHSFESKRASQRRDWMEKLVRELLDRRFKQHPAVAAALPALEAAVTDGAITPYAAASELLSHLE